MNIPSPLRLHVRSPSLAVAGSRMGVHASELLMRGPTAHLSSADSVHSSGHDVAKPYAPRPRLLDAATDSIALPNGIPTPSAFRRELRRLRHADGDALHDIVLRSVQTDKLGEGAEAQVYPMPEYPHIALRVNTRDEGDFAEPYRYVPVRYTHGLEFMKHDAALGIAHAALVSASHPAAASSALSPHEAMPNLDTVDTTVASIPFWLLRRCGGQAPTAGHAREFARITRWGTDARHFAQPGDESTYRLYCRLRYEDRTPSLRAAHRDTLAACAAGTYVLPPELTIGATETCTPEYQRLFLRRYRAFADAYAVSAVRIAALPQHVFDAAVATLRRLDDVHSAVRMDFEHAGNILIDFKRERISFFDVSFSHSTYANARAGDLDLFLDALLGRGQSGHWSDILGARDAARLHAPIQLLIEKISAAAQRNGLAWRTRSPSAVDELARKFAVRLPQRERFAEIVTPELGTLPAMRSRAA